MRIVSLVPSETELLHALKLDFEVVGITKFCTEPHEWFRTKARIGGTKNVDVAKVLELKPDLVLANHEENVKEQVEALMQQVPVDLSTVRDLDGALEMIRRIGALTSRRSLAENLAHDIEHAFDELPVYEPIRVAYLIWKDPLMTIGHDTFIHAMLQQTGFVNVFAEHARYPVVATKEILEAHPQLLLLSSEPYPFAGKHLEAFSTLMPGVKPVLVDGSYFSWYGSRLLHAPAYFRQLREQISSDL